MARIVFGTYMVRYPLGGMLSCCLQWIVGFQRLGHDVTVVEKRGWPNSCYNPVNRTASDDCAHGIAVLRELLGRFGLEQRWCYVDAGGNYHGLSKPQVQDAFASADAYVDYGSHGLWREEAERAATRVYVDGEPAFRQMRMASNPREADKLAGYDHYFTVGQNIGTPRCTAPTAGIQWNHVHSPVVADLFTDVGPPPPGAAFTTVMNWQSHDPLIYEGQRYGQKDVEFEKFLNLPRHVAAPMEVAVSGQVPEQRLRAGGWRVRDAQAATISYDGFIDYIAGSRGEFTVCKNVFVATRSGWFSDRSAVYLACGRPVVMQDTGFSAHLPVGRGLMAVNTMEEAAQAITAIECDYAAHSEQARQVAREHLDHRPVIGGFLSRIGLA
jgi:hypothetical protein